MQNTSTSIVLRSLLRADFTTQWRNRRSFILVLIIPVVILLTLKNAVDTGKIPPQVAVATCITIGLMAIGLMGYTNTIARDRDKRIFQRLRVAPLPSWSIMASRLSVQIAMIVVLIVIVCLAGFNMLHFTLPPATYALLFLCAVAGGAVYLGMGQVIVGLIRSPETVNSTTRLVYFVFIMSGMIGQSGLLGDVTQEIVQWSPYGTVERIVASSMNISTWNLDSTYALLLTIGYAGIFFFIGIRKFQWDSGK